MENSLNQNEISILDYEDYRKFLQDLFAEKLRKNPSYSKRSYARNLGVSHTHLLRVLNGSKKLSVILAESIANRLKLSHRHAEYFDLLVRLDLTKDQVLKTEIENLILAKAKNSKMKELSRERFQAISEWQHFAILAMSKMKDFRSDKDWLASKLGITAQKVEEAIERLLSLDLIERTEQGHIKAVETTDITTGYVDLVSQALQENHKQQMERAKLALSGQEPQQREFLNVAVCIQPKDIDKAKALLRNFIEKDRKSTRLNSSHTDISRMPSSA